MLNSFQIIPPHYFFQFELVKDEVSVCKYSATPTDRPEACPTSVWSISNLSRN